MTMLVEAFVIVSGAIEDIVGVISLSLVIEAFAILAISKVPEVKLDALRLAKSTVPNSSAVAPLFTCKHHLRQ
jgi:hypothetical protein